MEAGRPWLFIKLYARTHPRNHTPSKPKPGLPGTPGAGDPKSQPQQATTGPGRPRPDRQRKADIFEVLRRLNRGYGVALDALDKLEAKAYRIFPTGFLHGYRNRAEVLRAETNRDLLRIIAGREDQDAEHFGSLRGETAARPHQT